METSSRLLPQIDPADANVPLWDQSPNLIFVKDVQGRYLYVNKQFERALRVSREQVIGKTDADLFPPEQAALFQANDRRVFAARVALEFEEVATHEDGPHISIVHKFPLFTAHGEMYAVGGIVTDITEYKRAHEALRRSEERFRLLVEGIRDYAIFMLDARGCVISWNEGAARIKGYAAEEVLGQHVSLFYGPEEVAGRFFERELETAVTQGRAEDDGWRVRKDGSRYWANDVTTALRDDQGNLVGFAKIVRDLTERRRGEEALRQSAERNQAILDTSLDSIVAADHEGRIIEFNHVAERTFGFTRSEVLGKLLADTIVPTSARDRHQRGIARFVETGEAHVLDKRIEMTARRADGSEFPVELSLARVALEGPPIFTGFIRDITERKRAEEEVSRLRRQLELENAYLNEQVKEKLAFGEIVGQSATLRNVLQQIEMVAPTDAAVLISGESGTGKELVARAIHERSPRRGRPLVTVNCASVPRELFESEFFGHVKGAFTGALRDRVGRFQLADKGTIFLDEVGEIPLELQSKLLRVLQEGQLERVGEDQARRVDVRLIAATNRDLREELEAGRFRRDLYYRLCVFPVQLPPLRERAEDIGLLAAHFLGLAARRLNRPELWLTEEGLALLQSYDWPGNIRELHHVIERAAILSPRGPLRIDLVLGERDLRAARSQVRATVSNERVASAGTGGVLSEDALGRVERDNLVAALQRSAWKISGPGGAAEILGVKPTTLASRIKRFGIERPPKVG